MSEGVSSLNRPAPVSVRNRSDDSNSKNEDGKGRFKNRTAQRGEVNRVLERMNSQSAMFADSSGIKTKGRRGGRLCLTDHGDFSQNPRSVTGQSAITQSLHVGGRGARKPSVERLDSEASFGSTGSFEEEPMTVIEKPGPRTRPNLRSGALNAANRVLGRMESKRTLTDLIEDNNSKTQLVRTRSGSSNDGIAIVRPSTTYSGMSTSDDNGLSQTKEKDSSGEKEAAPKNATRKPRTRKRPTLADLGIPARNKPIRSRSEASVDSTAKTPFRRRPIRASSTTGTPGTNLAKPQSPKVGRFPWRRNRRGSTGEIVHAPNEESTTPGSNNSKVAQEAYALERDAERKRLEAMELLRQAEEAEEEANRKLAEAAGSEEPRPLEDKNLAPLRALSPVRQKNISIISAISEITVDEDDEEEEDITSSDSSDSGSDEDDDDDSSESSESGDSSNAESAAGSGANSDSSSDVYLDESERKEEVAELNKEPKPVPVSKAERLPEKGQFNGLGGLIEEENSGDEEEIQRRAEQRRRLRESGHIDIMSSVRDGGLHTKTSLGLTAFDSNSEEEALSDENSKRRRERDRRIRQLEEKAGVDERVLTSTSSIESATLGFDSWDEESNSQLDAERARRKAERMQRRAKRNNGGLENSHHQSSEKAQRKAEREKEIEKRKAELEARRLEAQKRKEERRKLLGVRDVDE